MLIKKISLIIISLLILAWVIYFVEPPKDWQQASIFQILIFFIPLLLFLTFLADLLFNYLVRSFALGLGIMMLVVLRSVDQLNFATAPITIGLTLILIFVVFKKPLPFRNPKIDRFKNLFKKP